MATRPGSRDRRADADRAAEAAPARPPDRARAPSRRSTSTPPCDVTRAARSRDRGRSSATARSLAPRAAGAACRSTGAARTSTTCATPGGSVPRWSPSARCAGRRRARPLVGRAARRRRPLMRRLAARQSRDHADRALTRWLDLAPSRLPELARADRSRLRRSATGTSTSARSSSADGEFLVDGRAAAVRALRRLRPGAAVPLGPARDRARTSDDEALAALCESYARAPDRGRLARSRAAAPTSGGTLPDGDVFDDRLSHLLAEAAAAGAALGDLVRSRAGRERFMDWLAGPAPRTARRPA